MVAHRMGRIAKEGKGVSGWLLPTAALGWWRRRVVVQKCEYGKMLLEEWVVFQVEKWGSPLWDNTEWIQLFKITLCKYISVNSF